MVMALKLHLQISGPLENNVIILHDEDVGEGMLFDPSFDPDKVLSVVDSQKISITTILFTHGHFDHFAGLAFLLTTLNPTPRVALHPGDLDLWRQGGGSVQFRIPIQSPTDPDLLLEHEQNLSLGKYEIEVRHTPGHSPGSVIFHIPAIQTAIVGDLIFRRGVGRTDLNGGSFSELRNSIETQVYTLSPDTILIPGHGPNTTVADEMRYNPYVGIEAQ
jgi:glyoxylase-like metal-dependent hydrolase (beta-lactamase superfamily II)